MPEGKPAGVRCIHLKCNLECAIYHVPGRPKVCDGFQADPLVCGNSRAEALSILARLEDLDVDVSDY